MTYLSDNMYRQISKCTDKTPKKHYGGHCPLPPPPPSGYASVIKININSSSKDQRYIWFGGGNRFCCSVVKYNVLDTKGEGVGAPPTVEIFWKFGY